MTSGSGALKLKLLLALRELVASDPISVRLRRVARGIHTLVEPDFPSDLPQVWQRFHALKDDLAGKYALSREDQASIPADEAERMAKELLDIFAVVSGHAKQLAFVATISHCRQDKIRSLL
jgi:hypothetical protein